MALNKIHPCRFSLMLFVVTFEVTYTFYTLQKETLRYNVEIYYQPYLGEQEEEQLL